MSPPARDMTKGQRRGSAGTVLLGALLFCLLVHSEAAVFQVGDGAGWTFNVSWWPSTKRFQAGDQLLFQYRAGDHSVAQVDTTMYNRCIATAGAKIYTSGKDLITLSSGTSYFMCIVPGHCQAGMRIAVTAN